MEHTHPSQEARADLQEAEALASAFADNTSIVGAKRITNCLRTMAAELTLLRSQQPVQDERCPFCGSESLTYICDTRAMSCDGCGTIGPAAENDDYHEALRLWSARLSAPQAEASDEVIALAEALEVRRILEAIKTVAAIHPPDDMPTPYQSAWQGACEEIFYQATGCQWHMDEDEDRFNRVAAPPTQQGDSNER